MSSFYFEFSARDRVDGWRREADQTRRARQLPAGSHRSRQLRHPASPRRLLVAAVVIAGVVLGLLQV